MPTFSKQRSQLRLTSSGLLLHSRDFGSLESDQEVPLCRPALGGRAVQRADLGSQAWVSFPDSATCSLVTVPCGRVPGPQKKRASSCTPAGNGGPRTKQEQDGARWRPQGRQPCTRPCLRQASGAAGLREAGASGPGQQAYGHLLLNVSPMVTFIKSSLCSRRWADPCTRVSSLKGSQKCSAASQLHCTEESPGRRGD